MRKLLLTFSAVAIFALGTCIVRADTIDFTDQITLGPSPAGSLIFTSTGSGGFTLALNNLTGTAIGQGTVTSSGPYAILQNGASISGSLDSCGGTPTTCTFGITDTGGPIEFEYGTGGSFLTGDLQFEDLTQTPSTKTGVFDESLTFNLTGLGGSLAPDFLTGNGVVQLTLAFASTTSLSTLSSGHTLRALVHTGSVNPTVPEPASLGILGGGLLLCGILLRKKLSVRN